MRIGIMVGGVSATISGETTEAPQAVELPDGGAIVSVTVGEYVMAVSVTPISTVQALGQRREQEQASNAELEGLVARAFSRQGRRCETCKGQGREPGWEGNDESFHPSPVCRSCQGTGRIIAGGLN